MGKGTSGRTPEAREQLFLAEKDFRTFHSSVEGLERANEASRLLGGECFSREARSPLPRVVVVVVGDGTRAVQTLVTSNAHLFV